MHYTPQNLVHFEQLCDQATALAQDPHALGDLPLRVTQWVTAATLLLQATFGPASVYCRQFQQAYRAALDPAGAGVAAQTTLRHGQRIIQAARHAYAAGVAAAEVAR